MANVQWSNSDFELNQEMMTKLLDSSTFTLDQVHRWALLWVDGYRDEFAKTGKIGPFIDYYYQHINESRDMLIFCK